MAHENTSSRPTVRKKVVVPTRVDTTLNADSGTEGSTFVVTYEVSKERALALQSHQESLEQHPTDTRRYGGTLCRKRRTSTSE